MRYKLPVVLMLSAVLFRLGSIYNFDFRYVDFGTVDWIAYWTIPRAILLGKGFYDYTWLQAIQGELGYTLQFAEASHYPVRLLWNPPPLILLLIPFALLPFTTSVLVWMGFSTYLFMEAAARFNRALPRPLPELAAMLVPLLLLPFFPAMCIGQISPVNVAFLILAWEAQRQGKQAAAGLLLIPVMLKPHLLFLATTLIFLLALKKRQWRTFLAFGGGLASLAVVAFVIEPNWLSLWQRQGAPISWQTSAIFDLLYGSFNLPAWVKVSGVPLGLGVALWRYHQVQEITPRQLAEASLLSVIFSPYLWVADFSVLLPAALLVLAPMWHHSRGRFLLPSFVLLAFMMFSMENNWRNLGIHLLVLVLFVAVQWQSLSLPTLLGKQWERQQKRPSTHPFG